MNILKMKKTSFVLLFILAGFVSLTGCQPATPTALPFPTQPSPVQVSVTVTRGDGTSIEMPSVMVAERIDHGWRTMGDHLGYEKFTEIHFYSNLENIRIPLSEIQRVESVSDQILRKNHLSTAFVTHKVTLVNGEEIVGQQLWRTNNDYLNMKLFGMLPTAGNQEAAEYSIWFSAIDTIVFSQAENGDRLAEVTDGYGNTTRVLNPWLMEEYWDQGLDLKPIISVIAVQVNGVTRDIEINQIAEIEFYPPEAAGQTSTELVFPGTTITLNNGEKLMGSLAQYALVSKSPPIGFGQEAGLLYTDFDDNINDLQKIVFH